MTPKGGKQGDGDHPKHKQRPHWIVRVAEVLCYLPLFVWRGLARSLLLTVTAAPIALPILAIVILHVGLPEMDVVLGKLAGERHRVAQAVVVLVTVGLFAGIMKAVTMFAYRRLRSLAIAVWAVLREGWIPPLDIRKSLEDTRRIFAKIPENLKENTPRRGTLDIGDHARCCPGSGGVSSNNPRTEPN